MRSRWLIVFVGVLAGAGCRQLLGLDDLPARDASSIAEDSPLLPDAYVADAGLCQSVGATCEGPTLRTCTTLGQLPNDTPCPWGCSTTGIAHCARLKPSGGAVVDTDLDEPVSPLADVTIPASGTTIDTDAGTITNVRNGGTGIKNGIDYAVRGAVAVFRFKSLVIEGATATLTVTGTNALALVGIDGITIDATVSLQGPCSGNSAGPGGRRGGDPNSNGLGTGGGSHGEGSQDNSSGGGGGGFGAVGGMGGPGQNQPATGGGPANGESLIMVLVGGSGGGGGGGVGAGGSGGGGGGAVQLVSNGTIRISAGGISAGGCGGKHGVTAGGGGGGAGGAVLIEGPIVDLSSLGAIAVNGGAGAAGRAGTDGQNAGFDRIKATGGNGGNNAGLGGDGAAAATIGGSAGGNAKNGGGGGGAVGRIRINTFSGTAVISGNAILSPALDDNPTSASQGLAALN